MIKFSTGKSSSTLFNLSWIKFFNVMLNVSMRIRGLLLRSNALLYACTARAARTVVLPEPKTPRTLCSKVSEYMISFCLSEYLYGTPCERKCKGGVSILLKFSYRLLLKNIEGRCAIMYLFFSNEKKLFLFNASFPIKSILYFRNVWYFLSSLYGVMNKLFI